MRRQVGVDVGHANEGRTSPALSQDNLLPGDPSTRKVAVLAADGLDARQAASLVAALSDHGVSPVRRRAGAGGEGSVQALGQDAANTDGPAPPGLAHLRAHYTKRLKALTASGSVPAGEPSPTHV
ncbi:hypothetical protein GCM10009839_17820 [Catenulispora yoronensis]|uniref:Uncharacterized protein n=1 Tax=Catenulispora yoronensis TaxID=450799 RepID=A0ABN2TUD5_9ACTN